MTRRLPLAALALLATAAVAPAQGTYFDLQTLTSPGTGVASYGGVLGSSAVTVAIGSNPNSALRFNDTTFGSSWGASTSDGTSPQYSYNGIYTNPASQTDRIGYSRDANANTVGTASRVTITFAVPVTGLRFHLANLDLTRLDFSATPGVTLQLLSGNGSNGGIFTNADGLGVSGSSIVDRDNTTFQTTNQGPENTPLTTGDRSAYGTVAINSASAISTLSFDFVTASTSATVDNGSFTFSATPVPEPATVLAAAVAGLAGARCLRRRVCTTPGPG